jgi:hypothetical protein
MIPKKFYIEPRASVLDVKSEAVICQSGLQPLDPNGIEQGSVIPDTSFNLL